MASIPPGTAVPGSPSPVRAADSSILIRHVRPEDAPALYALVRAVGTLEVNSAYAYALCADHFRKTTVVAERADVLVGFVVAYRPPVRPHSLFVWQVGVAVEERRTGLGRRLLASVVAARGARNALFLEATVAPDNLASRRLFESFAATHRAPVTWSRGFDAAHLPTDHPPEPLISIGPLVLGPPLKELP